MELINEKYIIVNDYWYKAAIKFNGSAISLYLDKIELDFSEKLDKKHDNEFLVSKNLVITAFDNY